MSQSVPEHLLCRFSGFVADRMGLHFPRPRWRDLERSLRAVAHAFHFEDPAACIDWLMSSPPDRQQMEILASHLTVGETYFFRELASFKAFEDHILPELIRARRSADRRLRIWCAGCCTGEEAYSIAITLSNALPDLKTWRITLLATDINPHFLRKAGEGIYGEWSFRNVSQEFKERYCRKTGVRHYEILPSIKGLVTFSYLNLADDIYPSLLNGTSDMDVIFCRNVLMYFTPEHAGRVMANHYRALVDGGWLIVSPSETLSTISTGFMPVNLPGAVLYRKTRRKSSTGKEVHLPEMPSFPAYDSAAPVFPPSSDMAEALTLPAPGVVTLPGEETASPASAPYTEALALYEEGRYPEAAAILAGLVSQPKPAPEIVALLARTCANQGKLPEARAWAEQAIAADRLEPKFHGLRAAILEEQGELDEAMKSLRHALYLDQSFVPAHVALGHLARRRRSVKQARKHFDNALLLLRAAPPDQVLPDAGGLTAGRLIEIIEATLFIEQTA